MSARVVRVAAFVLLVVVLAYVAALQHQANCIDSGHVGCSVLPWDNGHPRPANTGWG